MPSVSDKTLVIRIPNPDSLRQHIDLLAEALRDIQSVNLNNQPVQWHSKLRWEEQLGTVLAYFQRMLPRPETREE